MEDKNKLIECKNKCWCIFCKNGIPKGEHYLRFNFDGGNRKVRKNICIGCINKMNKEINRTELKNKILRETEKSI